MTNEDDYRLHYQLQRYKERFLSCSIGHSICLKLIWPLFNRSRLKRFNDLWESGLNFHECWRVSK
jgi:hypothetical protein